jgi:ketosteroid isomerase-like protein
MNKIDQKTDEAAIRELIVNWAKAVRAKDLNGILANHSPEILMFDVPPPLQSKGIDAYKRSWDFFFSWARDFGVFDIDEMTITAGDDVAFATVMMHCAGAEENQDRIDLEFRLTVGLRKIGGQWIVMHEHHSIPATASPSDAKAGR